MMRLYPNLLVLIKLLFLLFILNYYTYTARKGWIPKGLANYEASQAVAKGSVRALQGGAYEPGHIAVHGNVLRSLGSTP